MFYNTSLDNHNLRHNPFKSCIIPRPIAWISTISQEKIVNIAPYSYFNAIADLPPMVMFASGFKEDGALKDTIRNIKQSKEFVVNIVPYSLKDKMQLSSQNLPYNNSEAEEFGINLADCKLIKTPRIKEVPISLECEYVKIVSLDHDQEKVSSQMVIGKVIGIHIQDEYIADGKIDVTRFKPIARLGYDEYAVIEKVFKMKRG